MRAERVAVIGAGIAGLAAARTLSDRGFTVQLLERAPGVGGRSARRRADGHCFDHGAQYFTARDPRFVRYVRSWVETGLVAPWEGRIVALKPGEAARAVTPLDRYVGVPGMNAMAHHLAMDLDLTAGSPVTALAREADAWLLRTANTGSVGPFDAVVVAMPPAQMARITAPVELLAASHRVDLEPCWCAMAAFGRRLPVDFDGAFVEHSVLRWIARDSSKPGRPGGERWVLHAGGSWSAARLAVKPDEVAQALLAAFFDVLGGSTHEPEYLAGHRWTFARPTGDTGADCVWHANHAIALAGDWCRGGRVEGAFLSGIAAANRIIGNLS